MTVAELQVSPRARRWALLLLLSAAFHLLLLSALALRLPNGPRIIAIGPDVDVVAAPSLVRWPAAPAKAAEAPVTRVSNLVSASAPRYAGAPAAATGETSDAIDLFGPVFADGLWPRPVLVRSEPCDPDEPTPAGDACRRDLMLIGLASDAGPGAKAQP